MNVLPSYDALSAFFGAGASIERNETPHGISSFTVELDTEMDKVWLQLLPFAAEAHLRWVGRPFRVFDLSLTAIRELEVKRTDEEEYLVVRFDEDQLNDLTLWVRPKVMVFWGNSGTRDE